MPDDARQVGAAPTKPWTPAHLEISRIAVGLILDRGLADTNVEEIAKRSARSPRTIWRYFNSPEGCVEPLLKAVVGRFVGHLSRWPLARSIEEYLPTLRDFEQSEEETADDLAAIALIARLRDHPALRNVWLAACSQSEAGYLAVVARRSDRSIDDFEARVCAASTMAAVRIFYESLPLGAGRTRDEIRSRVQIDRLAAVIRSTSTLPICDAVRR